MYVYVYISTNMGTYGRKNKEIYVSIVKVFIIIIKFLVDVCLRHSGMTLSKLL